MNTYTEIPMKGHCHLPFLNSFTPEFLKWTLPSLNLDTSIIVIRISVNTNKMANHVDPDETAHY